VSELPQASECSVNADKPPPLGPGDHPGEERGDPGFSRAALRLGDLRLRLVLVLSPRLHGGLRLSMRGIGQVLGVREAAGVCDANFEAVAG
jgi:hypothetical protein